MGAGARPRATRRRTSRFAAPRATAPVPLISSNRWLWSRLRRVVLVRDRYRCQYCGRSDVPMTVDHRIPRVAGGTDAMSNLVACCARCQYPSLRPVVRRFDDAPAVASADASAPGVAIRQIRGEMTVGVPRPAERFPPRSSR